MSLTLKVPTIMCNGCAQTITESIQTISPDAKVEVDVTNKTVVVKSAASSESIKQAIVASGHTVADYQ
jgi:copper chaperone